MANPDDPIDVTVFVDGTLHPANQVVRSGSFLYIMGLQAGTEYSLRIGLSNVFGTEWVNTTVRPALGEVIHDFIGFLRTYVILHFTSSPLPSGRPSTPQVALIPTAGSLRVQLTTMYPGTRESTLQYSISTSTSPRSRQQTGQQTLPVTDLTTPVSGSEEVALDPGTYSVTVTVTNQHGDTTSVPQESLYQVSTLHHIHVWWWLLSSYVNVCLFLQLHLQLVLIALLSSLVWWWLLSF